MRQTKPRETTRVVQDLTAVLCDRCDKNILRKPGYLEGTHFTVGFSSYGSMFDLEHWQIDICDECAEWLRDQFIRVEVERG